MYPHWRSGGLELTVVVGANGPKLQRAAWPRWPRGREHADGTPGAFLRPVSWGRWPHSTQLPVAGTSGPLVCMQLCLQCLRGGERVSQCCTSLPDAKAERMLTCRPLSGCMQAEQPAILWLYSSHSFVHNLFPQGVPVSVIWHFVISSKTQRPDRASPEGGRYFLWSTLCIRARCLPAGRCSWWHGRDACWEKQEGKELALGHRWSVSCPAGGAFGGGSQWSAYSWERREGILMKCVLRNPEGVSTQTCVVQPCLSCSSVTVWVRVSLVWMKWKVLSTKQLKHMPRILINKTNSENGSGMRALALQRFAVLHSEMQYGILNKITLFWLSQRLLQSIPWLPAQFYFLP